MTLVRNHNGKSSEWKALIEMGWNRTKTKMSPLKLKLQGNLKYNCKRLLTYFRQIDVEHGILFVFFQSTSLSVIEL